MLVIDRKKGEETVIGLKGDIVVKIVKIKGNVVKIGIDAPIGVRIVREEAVDHEQQ